MKKKYILIGTLIGCSLLSFKALTNSSGSPAGRSGSPTSSSQTCASSGCHSGGPAITTQTITISTDIPTDGFVANTDYTITVVLDGGTTSVTKGGFQASIEGASSFQGTLSAGSASDVQVSNNFVTHNSTGAIFSGNSKTYTFTWNSGAAVDASTVYVAANFSNNNGGNSGDAVATETLVLNKNMGISLVEPKHVVIKMYPNPATDILTLESVPVSVRQLDILNIKGQKVKSFIADNALIEGLWELSLEELTKGQYFISSPTKTFETMRVQIK